MAVSPRHFHPRAVPRRELFSGSRRLFAELGDVPGNEDLGTLRIALEALRVGTLVLVAPVPLLLEFGNQAGVAQGTLFFRHAVLDTPPAVVVVAVIAVVVIAMIVTVVTMIVVVMIALSASELHQTLPKTGGSPI